MRRWNRLYMIVALLSAILIVSVVFSSGAIDVLTLSLESPPATAGAPESSSQEVLVDPHTTIKDYVNDPGYQIGDTFQVHVNITDAVDLFSWQLNISWDPSMLNVTDVIASEFLNRTYPTANTTSHELGFVINKADNVTGYTASGESILGGDTGVSGSGRLVTIEFQVVDYGYTTLNISVSGDLPTILLNSTLDSTAFDIYVFRDMNGWFDNRITGDSDSNGVVTISDMGEVSDRWTAPPGILPYARFVDWDPVGGNGIITISDMGIVSDNWGRVKP